MSVALIVLLPGSPGGQASWIVAGATGAEPASGSLSDLAAARAVLPRRLPLVAVLPVSGALLSSVGVPARQQRQLLQALPYLIEENLAADIESFHVVPGARLADGRLQVGALSRKLLADALATLQESGLDPEYLTVDAALLVPEQGAAVLLDGGDSLVANAEGLALSCHEDDLPALGDLLAPAGTISIRITSPASLVAARALEACCLDAAGETRVVIGETPVARLAALAGGLTTPAALKRLLNFRQGEFAARGDVAGALGFDWRPLAWLAAGWILLVLGHQVAAGITYGRAADAVREAEVALYRQVFPGAGQVPRPRAQMEGQVRASSSGGGFVELVAETSTAIAGLNGNENVLQPRHVGWDSAEGRLQVDIVARRFEDLEKLRQALEGRGMAVEIGSGVAQDGGYKARVNVGRAS